MTSLNTKEDKTTNDFTVDGSGDPQNVTSEEVELEQYVTSDTNTPVYNTHPNFSQRSSSFSRSDLSSHRTSSQNPILEDE